VETVITDYHVGGSGGHPVATPEGMPAFMEGPVYGGMIKAFKQNWGDSMVDSQEKGEVKEIPFGKEVNLAGVEFRFDHGAASDFPGASLVIGGKVYYTHWAPSKSHVSPLQVSSREAVEAEIAATKAELGSGCEYFIGGHGGQAQRDAVEFKLAYLEKLKSLSEALPSAEALVEAMKAAFPGLPGEDNLAGVAAALYKK